MSLPPGLASRARAWLAEDPDPATRAELEHLLAEEDEAGLRERFDSPLSFGTAGVRGPLGAGPARFNRAVVRKTTCGLLRFLAQGAAAPGAFGALPGAWAAALPPPPEPGKGVVVGHDARHGSQLFARDAARVLAAGAVRALQLPSALPTPVAAFAVRYLQAGAGVMVTASHNPAADNGYKVYLGDGAQVLPPYEEAIGALAATCPVPQDADLAGAIGNYLVEVDEARLLEAYSEAARAALRPAGPRRLRCVYSPLHGVGGAVLPRLMEEAGFDLPFSVPEQAEPDPDFPTAPFPNPEEPGVMDLAIAWAAEKGADLVLVNDPDADRLAVAVPDTSGAYRVLSGDELGVLIADHLMSATSGPGRLVATTVVSSTMLKKMAEASGVSYVETLTGFKWVARAARLRPGHRLLFGYEEALGYAVSEAVADKDGLSAALVVAEMAASAKEEGTSLLGRLDQLAARFGVHATSQWSLRAGGAGAAPKLAGLLGRWLSVPPGRLGGLPVAHVRDLSAGEAGLPPAQVVVLELAEGGRVALRPSGTEPKLKVYFEVATGPCDPADLPEARRKAGTTMAGLRQDVASQLQALFDGAP